MGVFDFLFNREDKEPYDGETLEDQPLYNLSNSKSKLVNKSRFLLLASYSKKDKNTYKNVKQAIKEMGYTDDLIFVRNNTEIIKFGVIDTPALVVDGKVVAYGRHFELEDIKELFKKHKFKADI